MKKIKAGLFSRSLEIAKISVNLGVQAASHAASELLKTKSSPEDTEHRFRQLLESQMKVIAQGLGELKGSAMKVGQLLSMMGEHFLPPEANRILKSLQMDSPPLAWESIEKVLQSELGPDRLEELDISQQAFAAASLGQVHLARRKKDGLQIALKVQYPGVARAIDGDLAALRFALQSTRLLPSGARYDALFEEVREMLHQEVDYQQERSQTEFFEKAFAEDPRYLVVQAVPEFSTEKVLATKFVQAHRVDDPEVLALSLARRNEIGKAFLDLYLRELFELKVVQTDPHLGNFKIRLEDGGKDRVVLLDFGATRSVSDEFLNSYCELVTGALLRDRDAIIRGGRRLRFLQTGDTPEQEAAFVDFCELMAEPLHGGVYNFGATDLPKRLHPLGTKLAFALRLRPPPREVLFIDRKMAGIFVLLKVLRCEFDPRPLVEARLQAYRSSRPASR